MKTADRTLNLFNTRQRKKYKKTKTRLTLQKNRPAKKRNVSLLFIQSNWWVLNIYN